MKKKTISLFIAVLLVAILACVFVACNNNDDEYRFTEDMTCEEMTDALFGDYMSFQANLKKSYKDGSRDDITIKYAENGWQIQKVCNYPISGGDAPVTITDDYSAISQSALFYELKHVVYIYVEKENGEQVRSHIVDRDYTDYEYDFSNIHADVEHEIKEIIEYFFELREKGEATFEIQDDKLTFNAIGDFPEYDELIISFTTMKISIDDFDVRIEGEGLEMGSALDFESLSDTECRLTYVGEYLTNLIVPETVYGRAVVSIGNAFRNCGVLKSVTIPVSVKTIGDQTSHFVCPAEIHYNGTKAQWKEIVKLGDMDDNYTVYCTDGTVTKSEDNWISI